MDFSFDTLRAFLITAGCPENEAWSSPDDSLPSLDRSVRERLGRVLSEGLGIPPVPETLIESGSLTDWQGHVAGVVDDVEVRRAAVARIRARSGESREDGEWGIGRMVPADAPGMAALFLDVYDERYPVVSYYVPEWLIALNRHDEAVTVVARRPSGEIGGQGTYFRGPAPNPRVYEVGQIQVARALRMGSLTMRLFAALSAVRETMKYGDAFFGEAVCTHLVTQKLGARNGYRESGIELSLMPAETYGVVGARRVSCVLSFVTARSDPSPLYLPACHRAVMEEILSASPLAREVVFSEMDTPEAEETVLSARVFEFASVERVQVSRIGRDFAAVAREVAERGDRLGLEVTQVHLNASAPGTAFAVAALRRYGFIFSAHAPWWFVDGDGLLMQRLASPPDFAEVRLWSDTAKSLLAHIRAEWETRETAR